jgi:CRISPR-associated protein Cmr6
MSIEARRNALAGIALNLGQHPGLVLQRYLAGHADKREKQEGRRPETELLKAVAGLEAPPAYLTALKRWQHHLEGLGATCFPGTLATPLAVGLGNESPLENGLTVQHTYGMPVIPGSALKGLARRAATQGMELQEEQRLVLFGEAPEPGKEPRVGAGFITWWDAWYLPDSAGGRPFKQDVVTVHHPEYYGGRGTGAWPTDFDDPNPVSFLAVKPGARFLFALSGPEEWVRAARRLLCWGLENLGAGAKTNSGYGYFQFQDGASAAPHGAAAARARSTAAPGTAASGAPPQEVTLPNALLQQRPNRRGGVEGIVGDRLLEQREWQKLTQKLHRQARAQVQRGRVRATVTLRSTGGNTWLFVDVKDVVVE